MQTSISRDVNNTDGMLTIHGTMMKDPKTNNVSGFDVRDQTDNLNIPFGTENSRKITAERFCERFHQNQTHSMTSAHC
jgi:hypothetical protein